MFGVVTSAGRGVVTSAGRGVVVHLVLVRVPAALAICHALTMRHPASVRSATSPPCRSASANDKKRFVSHGHTRIHTSTYTRTRTHTPCPMVASPPSQRPCPSFNSRFFALFLSHCHPPLSYTRSVSLTLCLSHARSVCLSLSLWVSRSLSIS